MEGIQSGSLISSYSSSKKNNSFRANPIAFQTDATDSIVDNLSQKKNPLHLLILGILAGFAGPIMATSMVKMLKTDNDLGIKKDSVEKTLSQMWSDNNLSKKGVTQYFASANSEESKELIKNYGGAVYFYEKEKGINQIEAANERLSMSLHEAGHAINWNCTKLGKLYANIINKLNKLNLKIPESIRKYIQITPVSAALYLSTIFLMIGIANTNNKNSKKQSKEQENPTNKFSIKKLVHDNLGELTIAAFLPNLTDETTATIRALKATKKIAPEMLKPLRKNLLIALSVYFIPAGAALTSALAFRKYVDQVKAQKQS